MGNVFHKRSTGRQEAETHGIKNNLELYLDDVFERECVVKAAQDEAEFIKTGIEKLVKDIADNTLEIFSQQKKIDEMLANSKYRKKTKEYFRTSSIDIYFPITSESHSQTFNIIANKPSRSSITKVGDGSSIIKVGSFYEGTRNKFPDEFDFIFLLFSGKKEIDIDLWHYMRLAASRSISTVTRDYSLQYANGKRKLCLKPTYEGIYRHGPAYMLQFVYKDGFGKTKYITVDLVPAYKIVVSTRKEWYKAYVNDHVHAKTFYNMVMSGESCLFVGDYITFTELEVSFIRDVLTSRHKKVYRILKFLLNGHCGERTMKLCSEENSAVYFKSAYTSYMIKLMMIYHHDKCTNRDTMTTGPCVLQVLEELSKYEDPSEFPMFSIDQGKRGHFLVDRLLSLIDTLRSLQTTEEDYRYKRYRTTSVTMQYLEQGHKRTLKKVKKLDGKK